MAPEAHWPNSMARKKKIKFIKILIKTKYINYIIYNYPVS